MTTRDFTSLFVLIVATQVEKIKRECFLLRKLCNFYFSYKKPVRKIKQNGRNVHISQGFFTYLLTLLIPVLGYLSLFFFIISRDNGRLRCQGEFPVFQYDAMLENEKTLGTRLGDNYEKPIFKLQLCEATVAPRVLETTLDCLFGQVYITKRTNPSFIYCVFYGLELHRQRFRSNFVLSC